MNDAEKIVKVGEPLLYRMLEVFPPWALLAPVAFAFAVVFLSIFFRQQETLTGLLKTLFIPPVVVTVLSADLGCVAAGVSRRRGRDGGDPRV